jgi:hypothetical protein
MSNNIENLLKYKLIKKISLTQRDINMEKLIESTMSYEKTMPKNLIHKNSGSNTAITDTYSIGSTLLTFVQPKN